MQCLGLVPPPASARPYEGHGCGSWCGFWCGCGYADDEVTEGEGESEGNNGVLLGNIVIPSSSSRTPKDTAAARFCSPADPPPLARPSMLDSAAVRFFPFLSSGPSFFVSPFFVFCRFVFSHQIPCSASFPASFFRLFVFSLEDPHRLRFLSLYFVLPFLLSRSLFSFASTLVFFL